jgi:hypothetical protein
MNIHSVVSMLETMHQQVVDHYKMAVDVAPLIHRLHADHDLPIESALSARLVDSVNSLYVASQSLESVIALLKDSTIYTKEHEEDWL